MVNRLVASLLRFGQDRPATPLRSLCVAALDYIARTDGQQLDRKKRMSLNCVMNLGALMNDHFDQHDFSKRDYRKLRKQLAADETARAVYRVYFRKLRQMERNRPRLETPGRENLANEVAGYRENVVRLSLSALAAIALPKPEGADRLGSQAFYREEGYIQHLFTLVMLIQICDDLLDWRRDWRTGLPTYVTAQLPGEAEPGGAGGARFGKIPKYIGCNRSSALTEGLNQHGVSEY
jgi:hypothetical protein